MEFNYLDLLRRSIEIQISQIFNSVVTGGFILTLCFLVTPTTRLVNFVMLLQVVRAISLKSGCAVFCSTTEKVFKHIIFSDHRYEYIWFAFGCSPPSLVRLTGLTLHIFTNVAHPLQGGICVLHMCTPHTPSLLVSSFPSDKTIHLLIIALCHLLLCVRVCMCKHEQQKRVAEKVSSCYLEEEKVTPRLNACIMIVPGWCTWWTTSTRQRAWRFLSLSLIKRHECVRDMGGIRWWRIRSTSYVRLLCSVFWWRAKSISLLAVLNGKDKRGCILYFLRNMCLLFSLEFPVVFVCFILKLLLCISKCRSLFQSIKNHYWISLYSKEKCQYRCLFHWFPSISTLKPVAELKQPLTTACRHLQMVSVRSRKQ